MKKWALTHRIVHKSIGSARSQFLGIVHDSFFTHNFTVSSPFQVVDPSFWRESQYLSIWHHFVENTVNLKFSWTCLSMAATKFGGKNPGPEHNALLRSKVIHGSAKVNQRSNSLEMSCGHQILVEMTPDQSVMHWWGQRSCKGQLGSTRDKIA